jgi:hypothetical protein
MILQLPGSLMCACNWLKTAAVICDSQFAFALSVECTMLLCSHMCVMEQVNWLV